MSNYIKSYYTFCIHVKFLTAFICVFELSVIVLCFAFKVENPLASCRYVNTSSELELNSKGEFNEEYTKKFTEKDLYHYHFSNVANEDSFKITGKTDKEKPILNSIRSSEEVWQILNKADINSNGDRKRDKFDNLVTEKYPDQNNNSFHPEQNRIHVHRFREHHLKQNTKAASLHNKPARIYRTSRKLSARNLNWSAYNLGNENVENASIVGDAIFLARFGLKTHQRRVCSSYALFLCFVVFHAVCDFATLLSLLVERDRHALSLLLLIALNAALSTLFLFSGIVAFVFMSDGSILKDYYVGLFFVCQSLLRVYEFICARKLHSYYQLSAETRLRPYSALLPSSPHHQRHGNYGNDNELDTVLSDADTAIKLEEASKLFQF